MNSAWPADQHARLDGGQHVGAGTQIGLTGLAVDDDEVAFRQPVAQPHDTADTGDLQGTGDDGGMAGGRALLKQEAPQLVAGIFQQIGRTEITGDKDRIVRQVALARSDAGQDPQQPVRQILEIVQPLLDIGVAGLGEPGAVLVPDAVNGGLGGQAGSDRLFKRAVPAPVVGEHPVGFQHLERQARELALTAVKDGLDMGLEADQCLAQADFLDLLVLGQKILGRDRSLVQDDVAVGEALGEALALEAFGPVRRDLDVAQFVLCQQLAGGHRLGQDHGDGLDVLDFLVIIAPLGAVLDDENTDRAAAAQQGSTEEGVIGVLARLRPVGEAGVGRGVRQADGGCGASHLTDQALAGAQAGGVDGLGLQALGGEEFKFAGRAAQIDRTDLGHHRLGDDAHHRIEPVLGRSRTGHGFANLAKEVPWPRRQSANRHGPS